MPTLEGRAVVGALLNLLLLSLLFVPRTRSQGLPPAGPAHSQAGLEHHDHIFRLSHQLPDGKEMQIYLYKGAVQKYFFMVETSYTPLQITITPCASPVVWSLQRHPLPPKDFYDETREDPFLRHMEDRMASAVLLGNWSDEGRRTYDHPSVIAGLYQVTVTSIRSDSVLRILATTTGASHPMYPSLPADRSVKIVRVSGSAFTFRWPDAAGVNEGRPVEYCVAVTRVRNFRTQCSLVAHSKGDKKPVLGKKDQWGFTWEKKAMRSQRKKARPVKAISPRKIPVDECVGSKREFTFKKARKGKTYYVDVFVIDKATNKAEAFNGTMVKIAGKDAAVSPTRQIRDGERKLLKLSKDNVPRMITFEAKRKMALLSVELGVCSGKVPLEIYHNNKRVHRAVIKRWKRVRMKNVLPGMYVFKFPRLQRRKAFVSMYVTSRPSALTLPRNMSIKVFDSMTTCSNLTVAWMGTHKKQKYCLYVKEASKVRSLKRHKCSSSTERPKSERVLCMRYRNKDVSKAVMSRTITGLQPSTSYVVDVYLSRGRSGPVAYKSVNVKTKAKC